ncbi:MAG: hypothetical protein ACJAXA_002292, partial [Candidatus Aldehydirespiratoraceae bacterium]
MRDAGAVASLPETIQSEVCEVVRALAMTHPETEEGSACVNHAFRAGGKNFAFLGE